MSDAKKTKEGGASPTEDTKQEESDAPLYASKRRVVGTYVEGTVTLRELAGVEKVIGAPVLEGFPSVRITSIIAASYIVDQLKLPLVAVMTSTSSEFPAIGIVKNNQPSHGVRFYGDSRIVVIVSEVGLGKNAAVIQSVVKLIFDFATRHHCSQVYTIDGLPVESLDAKEVETLVDDAAKARLRKEAGEDVFKQPTEEERLKERRTLRYLTTSEAICKQLKDWGHTAMGDAAITGITGWILAEAPFIPVDGPSVTCLLAPVSSLFPDAWGAVNIIDLLGKLVPSLEIDQGPLRERANNLESKISKHIGALKTHGKGVAPQSMYM